MNLVAKEFVACQLDERGVLILSRFTGSAEEIDGAVSDQSVQRRRLRRGDSHGARDVARGAPAPHASHAAAAARLDDLRLARLDPRASTEIMATAGRSPNLPSSAMTTPASARFRRRRWRGAPRCRHPAASAARHRRHAVAPIAPRPEDAIVPGDARRRRASSTRAARRHVAIVTGRSARRRPPPRRRRRRLGHRQSRHRGRAPGA